LKKLRGRLTYANVVSTICLFILLGGAAYAAVTLPKNSVGSKQIKKNAVTTAKIKDQAVTAGKVENGALTGIQINEDTLSVVPSAATAATATTATTATSAANAANATNAANAQPMAFAHVNADGTLDVSNSKNMGSATVTHTSKGIYCFGDLPFTPRGGQATADAFGSGATPQFGLGAGCTLVTDEAFVDMFDFEGVFINAPFYVVFYG